MEAPRPFVRGQSQMRFLRRPRTFHGIKLKGNEGTVSASQWGVFSLGKVVHVLEASGVRHTSDEGCRSLF